MKILKLAIPSFLLAVLTLRLPVEAMAISLALSALLVFKSKSKPRAIYTSSLVAFLMSVILGYTNQNSDYGSCSKHTRSIADSICEFRHSQGRWPAAIDLYQHGILKENQKLQTLFGVDIQYDPSTLKFTADCPHEPIPLLSWISSTGYYRGCSGHGTSLEYRYKHLYGHE